MEILQIDTPHKLNISTYEVENFRIWLIQASTALAMFSTETTLADIKDAYILGNIQQKLHKATGKKSWYLNESLVLKLNVVEVETLYELLDTPEQLWENFESLYKSLHAAHNRHFSWNKQPLRQELLSS
jgi:hypothetical protein